MKKNRRILAALLAAALLPAAAFTNCIKAKADSAALASSYNSNVSNLAFVTEVEDQVQSNYCWAYMADSVLESYLIKTGRSMQPDFSESDMITQLSGGSTYGFNDLMTGGNYHQAVAYWTRGEYYGPRLEAYNSQTDYYVSETADLGRYPIGDERAKQIYIQSIKNLVVQYGAAGVSIYFNANDRAAMARDGAYYYPQAASPGVNHGVTVVGWNDDYQAEWFYNPLTVPQRPQNRGAFLVKNSWGKNDSSSIGGNTGYYWISYDNYFQDAFAVTQVMERSGLYDHIYETDYRGLSEYTSGSSYSQTYHLGTNTQLLSGFATYVQAGASYRFYANGQELTQLSATMAQSGYHTFRLANPMPLNGTTLELRVEVDSKVDAVPIACSAGSHVPDTGNVCLKAFTINTSNTNSWTSNPVYPVSTVAGVSLSPGSCSVRQGARQVFTAQVTGTGQPSQRVDWQLSGSSSAYTKLTDGVLYVGADESSDILYVYANSNADVTKGAMAKVTVLKEGTDANYYTVTFVNDGEVCKTQNVRYGGSAAAPAVVKNGYSLSWDRSFQYVTDNMVVNAVWTKIDNSNIPDDFNGNEDDNSGSIQEEYDGGTQIGTVNRSIYTCWEDGTAEYTKNTAKSRTSLAIPTTVTVGGRIYEVTAVGDSCVQKNNKLATVIIGNHVTEIGDNAFYGCKKLKKIKIKSVKVEYIGDDAFSGISAKAVIYVPRSCLAKYRAMIRESGNGKARVKAYN